MSFCSFVSQCCLQFPVQIAKLMAVLHNHFSENKAGLRGFCIFSSLSGALMQLLQNSTKMIDFGEKKQTRKKKTNLFFPSDEP